MEPEAFANMQGRGESGESSSFCPGGLDSMVQRARFSEAALIVKIVTRRSIAAGQFVNLDVSLSAGTWELACYEPGHYEAGMHKQLIVDKA